MSTNLIIHITIFITLNRFAHGSIQQPVYLGNMYCTVFKKRLVDCYRSTKIGFTGCSHAEDIALECTPFPITCPDLPAPQNGSITFSDLNGPPYNETTTAMYNCNKGYHLSRGSGVRTCIARGARGVWDLVSTPLCECKNLCS